MVKFIMLNNLIVMDKYQLPSIELLLDVYVLCNIVNFEINY